MNTLLTLLNQPNTKVGFMTAVAFFGAKYTDYAAHAYDVAMAVLAFASFVVDHNKAQSAPVAQ